MGFSFCLPFNAYYMQDVLGVSDPAKLKIYVAIFAAAAPFSIAIFGPIWGAVADQFGRRPMLLRAYTGSAIFLYLMGMADSVIMFIGIRCLQGILTGTMTAAQTMIATQTPEKHSGFALGALNSGVYSGATAGLALGGICADQFGYRNAFLISSLILISSVLLILFGTSENFEKPVKESELDRENKTPKERSFLIALMPILILLGAASFVRRFDMAMFPLLIQEIHGSTTGASTRFGLIMGAAAVAGASSGILLGYLADRFKPAVILVLSSIAAGIFMIIMGMAQSLTAVFILRFAVSFGIGGFDPIMQSWISNITPDRKRGRLFGWISSARAVGWMFAPLASMAVALVYNVRSVFFTGSILFFILSAAILLVRKRLEVFKNEIL